MTTVDDFMGTLGIGVQFAVKKQKKEAGSMVDLLITGGEIATDYAVFEGSIAVQDGKVASIVAKGNEFPEAKKVIDASGKIVMPGVIDSHVHIWEPGLTHRNDFARGTRAAAAGGITTILEHPLSVPPVKNIEAFELKYDCASKKCYVDFGLWGALVPDNVDEVATLMKAGCVAVKGFIPYATPEYPNVTDSVVLEAMEKYKDTNTILAFHAENAELAKNGAERLKALGRKDPLAHMEAREEIVELEAISRLILFAKVTGARIHIVHMTIADGAELIKQAKSEGVRVTAEVCPHHLTTNCEWLAERGPWIQCTPPLRRQENVDRLWSYIFDGTIDFIASDESVYTKEEKAPGMENIWDSPSGIPAIGTMVPLMIDAALNKKSMNLQKFVQLMSTNVAKVFGLYPKKGSILPGMDADFTIFDQHRKWTIDARKPEMYYECGWSPFDGVEVEGAVDTTIVRGKIIFSDGKVIGEQGYGEFQHPQSYTYHIR